MKSGYIRVSKQEQNEALQQDAGCEKYFSDKMTGAKFERKGLSEKDHEKRLYEAPPGVGVSIGETNRSTSTRPNETVTVGEVTPCRAKSAI